MIEGIETRRPRNYIERLRRDPRTRAMCDGWVAQATTEAEQRYPGPREDRQRAFFAARRAIELAMSFVLDNDGELAHVTAERDRLYETLIDQSKVQGPTPVLVHPQITEPK